MHVHCCIGAAMQYRLSTLMGMWSPSMKLHQRGVPQSQIYSCDAEVHNGLRYSPTVSRFFSLCLEFCLRIHREEIWLTSAARG